MNEIHPYLLKVSKDIIEKMKIIASNNYRTMNKEIEYVLDKYIKEYEKENGMIKVVK